MKQIPLIEEQAARAEQQRLLNTQLQKAYAPTSESGLILPMNQLAEMVADFRRDMEDDAMHKAQVLQFPSGDQRGKKRGMQSVDIDALQISMAGEYWERPSALSFDQMRMMVDQTPVLSAIVMTRVRQVQRFCQVQESGVGLGFVVRHVDKNHKLTPEETNSINLLQKFVTNCGWEFNPRKRKQLKRDNFASFMAKAVRDSLVMDSSPIETEFKRDRNLGIDGFYSVDGATIRLTPESGFRGDPDVFAVQVVQGRLSTAYRMDDLIYEPRNPRSDVMLAGYGLSEIELLIKIVTGYLNALSLNLRGFSDNSIPKGVLHLSGDYTKDDLTAFRRYWNSMVTGAASTWSVPVLVSKDGESKASFEKFGVDFDEMYFSKWMTFLTSIACGVYGMSPSEINFDSFSGGSTSPLGGSDTAEKLAESKDKGLRPLLTYYQNMISDYIISDFGDKYCFRWTGLDDADEAKRHETRKLTQTIDEMRAEDGRDPIGNGLGDYPVNPSLIGPYQAMQQANQQQDFGAPGAGDGAGAPGAPEGEEGEGGGDAPAEAQPGAPEGDEDGGAPAGDEPDEPVPAENPEEAEEAESPESPETVEPDEEDDDEGEEKMRKALDFGTRVPSVYRLGDEL